MLLDCLIPIAMKEKAGLSLLVKLEFKAPAFFKKTLSLLSAVKFGETLSCVKAAAAQSTAAGITCRSPHRTTMKRRSFFCLFSLFFLTRLF